MMQILVRGIYKVKVIGYPIPFFLRSIKNATGYETGARVRASRPAWLPYINSKLKSVYEQPEYLPRTYQRGFTLVELLVVLVVMGIALSMVMVQLMPDRQAPLRDEAARLALLLENAGLEARASGRMLAWSGEKNSYRFFAKKNINIYKDWVRIDDDSLFRPRILPEGVNIGEVSVEEQVLKPGEFVLLGTNTYTVPFRIRLTSEFGSASVTGKSTGDVVFALDNLPEDKVAQ
jgi:general secretion pathway protein H